VSSANDRKTLEVIEAALELAGGESKKVILDYVQKKYGMDLDALARYKGEFANYLGEILGDSADIIVARINLALEEYAGNLKNPLCYICNRTFSPEKMCEHLAFDHTKDEIAYHLGVIYIDDWREEAELRDENDSKLRQLLHN
jgi:hypothetical protein